MLTKNNIVVALIIIVIILYIYSSINVSVYEEFMEGLWVADEIFCEEAGLKSMLLYIGPVSVDGWFSRTRGAYVIAMDDVTNQSFDITYKRGCGGPFINKYEIHTTTSFEQDQFFPESLSMRFDIGRGVLQLFTYEDKTPVLYGAFYKQNDISAATKDEISS